MAKRTPLTQAYDGDWVTPVHCGYVVACCDCSLVHVIDIRINRSEKRPFVQFRVRRCARRTRAERKKLGIKITRKANGKRSR